MSYLIFGKVGSTLAESDHPSGDPWTRIVDFRGDATRRFVCEMQRPWSQAAAEARATALETELSLAAGDLVALDATNAEYNALDAAVYGPVRTADENARAARQVELRQALQAEIVSKNSLGPAQLVLRVPTAAPAQSEFWKALWFKLKEIGESGIQEEV